MHPNKLQPGSLVKINALNSVILILKASPSNMLWQYCYIHTKLVSEKNSLEHRIWDSAPRSCFITNPRLMESTSRKSLRRYDAKDGLIMTYPWDCIHIYFL